MCEELNMYNGTFSSTQIEIINGKLIIYWDTAMVRHAVTSLDKNGWE